MHTKFFFVLSASILLFSQCKKKQTPSFQLEVVTTDKNTNAAIPSAPVTLSYKSLDGNTYSSSFKLLESTLSDNNGISNFNVEYGTIIEFEIAANATDYFPYTLSINPDDLSKDSKNTISIPMQSTAEINISVKNQFPLNNQDQLVYNSTSGNCISCIQIPTLTLSGMQIDTTFGGQVLGNQHYRYTYITTKNNITTYFEDSVFCSAGTVSNITISF